MTMPSTPLKNLMYRAALPFMAPSPHKLMRHACTGHELAHLPYYEHLLVKHHVLGASLLICDGDHEAQVFTSVSIPKHDAGPDTLFRVASITKTATALVALSCITDGMFTLSTPARQLLPETPHADKLDGMTVAHLLCHTSGLHDTPAMEKALASGGSFDDVLADPDVRAGNPGEKMAYCNFGFGLVGCMLENVTGLTLQKLFQDRLFAPLGMEAAFDASTLDESRIMPISRVLPYRAGNDMTITKLGRFPLGDADPLRHFGHTAGAMYTNAASLSRMLDLLASKGQSPSGRQLIRPDLMTQMTTLQSSAKTRKYGLGLVLLERDYLSPHRLLGHQGFAYGCVDGAFIEEDTGRKVIFLNGGASEARTGKLGLVNRDVLKWALNKEMTAWK